VSDRIPIVIGIDGGATNSFGIAVDLSGRTLGLSRSGTLSFFGASMKEARRSLNQLIRGLEIQLPLSNQIVQTVMGAAAFFTEATFEQKEKLCRAILSPERTHVVSDCMTAYHGACLGKPGVLIICGTGSIVLAKNERGICFQAGGWGHILGDEGSAYWIAINSIKAAIAAMEGRGPQTGLLPAICEWFEVKELSEIVPPVYYGNPSKDKIAALSEYLATSLGSEDEVFNEICQRGGAELSKQVLTAIRFVDLKLGKIPIYLLGGVMKKNDIARNSLLKCLREHYKVKPQEPQMTPLLGSAAWALSEAGVPLNSKTIKTLKRTYSQLAK
jgi:glucosamine kinase